MNQVEINSNSPILRFYNLKKNYDRKLKQSY